MNIISKALDEATFRIPPQILETIFMARRQYKLWRPASLHQAMMDAVVKPRVLVDLNIYGGKEILVDMRGVPRERVAENVTVFRIPKSRTQGATILTALNITFIDPARLSTYGTPTYGAESYMLNQAQGMVDAMGTIPNISTAYIQIIGENVLQVRDSAILPDGLFLRCRIMMDDNLNHVQVRSSPIISKAVEYAIKSYIYNNHIIEMDSGELRAGQSLGVYKSIVESYNDAEENYQDHLKMKAAKVLFMNDNETFTRFIRLVNGGMR